MATTRLSDIIIPAVYESYGRLNIMANTSLFQAGVVATNDVMNRKAASGGITGIFPFWKDLDPTIEPNMGNDDPADIAIPAKIGTGQMNYRKSFLNMGWSAMNLVNEVLGADPMRRIKERTDNWWAAQYSRRAYATLKGVIADNIANDGGDMGVNIAGTSGSGGIMSPSAVSAANFTLGDATRVLGVVLAHSAIVQLWGAQQQIVSIPVAGTDLVIKTYMGYRIVMDDELIWSGTAPTGQFLTIFVGQGALGYGGANGNLFAEGEGIPALATEIQSLPDTGNGAGQQVLWERKTLIIQPSGFSWIEAPGSGGADLLTEFSPTLSDLQRAAHWDRIVRRKDVPLAYVIARAV